MIANYVTCPFVYCFTFSVRTDEKLEMLPAIWLSQKKNVVKEADYSMGTKETSYVH
jgi:hypothetical protein